MLFRFVRPRRVPPGGSRARQRQRRESRLAAVAVSAIVLLTVLVFAASKFGGTSEPKVQGVNLSATVIPQDASGVSVTATRGATFMEARDGLEAGTPLYRGTLERGQTLRLPARTLTLAIASPRNVVVRIDGLRVPVPAGGRLTVSPRG